MGTLIERIKAKLFARFSPADYCMTPEEPTLLPPGAVSFGGLEYWLPSR